MASCFPKTHRVLGLLWPEDLCMVDLWRVSPGSSQEAAEGVTPLPRGPSAFTLLHLSLPPSLHGPCFSAPRPDQGPACSAGVGCPGVTGWALRPGGR